MKYFAPDIIIPLEGGKVFKTPQKNMSTYLRRSNVVGIRLEVFLEIWKAHLPFGVVLERRLQHRDLGNNSRGRR